MIAIPFILNTLASFLVGLLVAKFLGPAEYGRYAVAMAIGIVVQTLAFDWLRLSATRFFSERQRGERPHIGATVKILFFALAGLTLVVAVLIYCSPVALPLAPALIALAALVALSNGMFDLSGAILRARFLNRSYRNLVLVRTGLSLLLVLGGAWLFASAEMALLGLVLSMAGAAASVQGDTLDWEAHPRLATRETAFDFARYALPIVAANGLYQLAPLMNRALASHTLDFAQSGQLSLAYDMGLRIIAAIGSALDVLMFQLAVRAEQEQGLGAAKAQVGFNIGVLFALLAPTVAGCWLVLPSFERLLIPEAFRGHFAHYFTLLLPAFFAFALSMFCLGPIFQIVRRTGAVVMAGAVALAVNAVAVWLLPAGVDASNYALAQSLSSLAGLATLIVLAVLIAPIRPDWRAIGGAALATAVMLGAVMPLRAAMTPGILALTVQGCVGFVVYAVLAYAADLCGLRGVVTARLSRRSPTPAPQDETPKAQPRQAA